MRADFAFSQVLDNARNPPPEGLAVVSFFAEIAIGCELNCANTRSGFFYKRTESKRTLNQDFLDRFFLHMCTSFDHDR